VGRSQLFKVGFVHGGAKVALPNQVCYTITDAVPSIKVKGASTAIDWPFEKALSHVFGGTTMTSSVPKKKATNDQQHFVSLDVLSVGGGGGGTTPDDEDDPPSLFLSIWQESTTKDKPVGEFGKLLSRYALSGTLNSRVVADQRYRIGSVKALFVGAAAAPVVAASSASSSSSSATTTAAASTNEGPCSSIEAIISLLYALAQSGSEELVVVAPSSRAERYGVVAGGPEEEEKSKIQDAVELLHGSRAHPKVKICELVQTDMRDCFWWRVFEDETSIVHAHWSTNIGLVYLFTLRDCLSRNADDDTGQGTSLLFLPEHANIGPCRDIFGDITAPTCAMPVFEEYPTTSGGAPAATTARLWCVVVVAAAGPAAGAVDRDGWIFLRMESSQHPHNHHHHRLLRRGFQQQERWKRIYPNLWKDGYFPWYQSPNDGGRNDDDSDTCLIGKTILMSQFGNKAATFCVVDRLVVGSNVDASTSSNETKMNADEASVRRFFLSSKSSLADDANEICLDDSDDENKNENKECDMFLQILGTGCAAPSPHRNASAHVLVLHGRSILLDAGEGTALQWDRYLPPQTSIGSIGIIWISHAHWDHFGGTYTMIGVSV
jgi:hypothetical protein